ncbi:PKD domain-containing protein [Chitinophaga ginsengisegetis]|uniref:PKD domain-containing protein n=1 Tax=Chitinophaga ginsengisegetis TaxID=393003 RepID=UPI000DB9AB99|nr:hypothetical protein [Chitinophaga ginsengisegetis]MDR6565480.1 putative esterase [Chitinophaga ginsengisegetis]MDR6645208.1 putative esterase [Chitinophaga ginsengisegetis]MDR6652200.1 putative esterase [Chitinophaga ginsengisegetis]
MQTAGLCEFYFARHEDVVMWPKVDPQTGTITDGLQLKAGKGWMRCRVLEADRSYRELTKIDPAGPYSEISVQGFMPGDSTANSLTLATMVFGRYVLVVKERTGIQRLLGSADVGVSYSGSYDSEDADGTRGCKMVFSWRTPISPRIYLTPVDAGSPGTGPGGPGGGPLVLVNAGPDQLELPSATNSLNLSGIALSTSGDIESYLWEIVSGPSGAVITNPNAAITTVTGVKPGAYTFKLTAVDVIGTTATDMVDCSIAIPSGGAIVVFAGSDQYLNAGVSKTNFYANLTIPPGVTVQSITWSVVTAGVSGIAFSNINGLSTGVTGIPVATETALRTTFRCTVIDNSGRSSSDDIVVSSAAPARMYSSGGYLDNKYDPANPALRVWAYECEGYDPLREGGYPLILFFHGVGVNGDQNGDDINQLLLKAEGLPYYLYNKLFPMKCNVVSAQLHTDYWTLETAQKVLTWAIGALAVNTNMVFATGLSSGGAGTNAVILANPNLLAGGIASNTTFNDVALPGNGAVIKNVPMMYIHSWNDTRVPPASEYSTLDDLDSILAADPLGIYPPLILMNWTSEHDGGTWNDMLYDKRWAPFDFEEDFFLFHTKDLVETAGNYVARAERLKTFYDYSRALLIVNRLSSGAPKTALLSRLTVVKNAMTTDVGHRMFMLNLGSNSVFNKYKINNVASSASGTVVSNLADIDNSGSGIGFTVVSNAAGLGVPGLKHSYMGMGDDMFNSSFMYNEANPASWKFTGLDPSLYFDVSLYHSNVSKQMYQSNNKTGSRSLVNGRSMAQSKYESYNTMFTTDHYNVKPNASGELIIDVSALDNFQFNANHIYQGNTVAILLRQKTAVAPSRTNFDKYNFAASNAAADPDFATMFGNPSAGVLRVADPVTGRTISTVSPALWANFGSASGNDNEAPVGAFADVLPAKVAQSAMLNYNQNFNRDAENFNFECEGMPGMGYPEGLYIITIYCSTSADFSPTRVVCKMGSSNGLEDNTIVTKNNMVNRLQYKGYLKDGETIRGGIYMPNNVWGVAFLNAITVEKVG